MSPTTESQEYEVVILGGGPAGSAAATLLARWGHSVLLLTRPAPQQTELAESLPPSVHKLLGSIGAVERMDAAGFVRATGNTVWWGAAGGRAEPFADGALGYQVRRASLQRLLLDVAEAAGATVERDASIREAEQGNGTQGIGDGRVQAVIAGAEREIRAPWILDCTGRAGVIARQGYRRQEPGVATLALIGAFQRPGGWSLDDETHTLVESYEDGWAWSVPVSDDRRYFTVMVDARQTEMAGGKELGPIYRAEMSKAKRLVHLLDGAVSDGPPWACSASVYSAERYADEGILLVGDAGSFLDPITSFGVKKALASGWRAAVVAHTSLTKPAMTSAALSYFDGREKLVHASYQQQSATVFREAGDEHRHAFWTARSGEARTEPDSESLDPDGDLDVDRLRHDPDVLSAFENLRQAPAIDLRPGPKVEIVSRPTIQAHEVVLEERIATPGMPTGIRHLRGVDVMTLLGLAGGHRRVPDLFEAYCRTDKPVILPDFLGVLSVMIAHGILVDSPDGLQ